MSYLNVYKSIRKKLLYYSNNYIKWNWKFCKVFQLIDISMIIWAYSFSRFHIEDQKNC
jgi:hypothetical protein